MKLSEDKIRSIAQSKIDAFMAGDENCTVHGPYKRKDGRMHCCIVEKKDGAVIRKQTISYPKLIAMIVTDGGMDPTLTVDHVDRDFTNDDVFNLRTIPLSQHASEDSKRVRCADVRCAWCNTEFTPTRHQINTRAQINAGPFCSRRCRGQYGSSVRETGQLIGRLPIEKTYYFPEK